jgi:hypothetical protein
MRSGTLAVNSNPNLFIQPLDYFAIPEPRKLAPLERKQHRIVELLFRRRERRPGRVLSLRVG